ncbi:unnamed protein product [Adineta steineri]|uniref:FAM234A/B beta-propeller domain-containing protein n=2 Tax=Adineta steineri TaxID=433720 RepID=A0A815B8J2_9BILA|nr:unnamed protein product [Adineta steineri]CAF4033373.1 unnamed protein product [Adineta steineri]
MNDIEQIFINDQVRLLRKSRFAGCCVTISLLIAPIICIVVILRPSNKVVSELKQDSLWFPSAGSESCIRLMDIDGDGLDDVIVSLTDVTTIANEENKDENHSLFCKSFDVEEPCSGTVYGIRGYDFKILWSFRIKQSIFELVCDMIDINNDGYNDCIGAGRQATVVAFDARHGKVIWDSRQIKSRHLLWNFYNPILLSIDVDHDGMNDILISHGGNPTIPSNVHEREAGCLIIISSRSGHQIGEAFFMPDGEETYMSPVLYDKSTVLFGTGGETVAGGLYSILIHNIIQQKNQYVTLVKSFTKGIMVPPIVLDMDYDGIDDILVSCFDGTLELIHGKTMRPLWTRIFDGFEFYASPAPGDFNSDSFVDFMIIINYGEWDRYDYSQVLVIDGLTGETIWTRNNTFGEFTAPLTLQMKKKSKYQDSFIYRQRGQTTEREYSNASAILIHGIGLQDGEISKDDNVISLNSNDLCDTFKLNDSISNIFLTNIDGTRLIASIYPPINDENDICSQFEPMERSGGAIGDVNGDGIFDTIDLTTFITKLTSHSLENFIVHSVLTRFSLDLSNNENQIVANYQAEISNKTINNKKLVQLLIDKNSSLTKSSLHNKDLSIIPKQTWNAYLGRFANSHYYRNI